MIELPEAITIAGQMTCELEGKQVAYCQRGNSPHKFAFYNHEPEDYAALMVDKTLGESTPNGVHIFTPVEPGDYVLVLGGGGERIFVHDSARTLPKKHQFLLEFTDGTYLTVTVQMWGSIQLLERAAIPSHPWIGKQGISPLSDEFTFEYLDKQFDALEEGNSRPIKFFMISEPGIWGVGNGCLQDILFRSRLHPRRKAVELQPDERLALYEATRTTLRQMTDQGGRDSELDLYGCAGRYHRILGSHTAGKPCPECGAAIQKISFLGGTSYFCPRCQV